MAGHIISNPFENSTSQGSQFNDPNKRSPTQQNNNNNQQQQNTQNIPNSNNDGNVQNFTTPDSNNNNDGNNNNNRQSNDPLMDFDKLWEDTPIDPKNPPKQFDGYLPKIDQSKFDEHLGKMDFTRNVSPETIKKITGDNPEAAGAFTELINSLGRQMFAMNFSANSRMMTESLGNVEKRFMDDLIPNQIQNRAIDDTVFSDHPLANNPKYKQMFTQVRKQFALKHPKASPEDLNKAATDYIDGFVKDAQPKSTQDNNTTLLQKGDGNADWASWIQDVKQN